MKKRKGFFDDVDEPEISENNAPDLDNGNETSLAEKEEATNVQQGIGVPVAALRGDRIEPGGEIT